MRDPGHHGGEWRLYAANPLVRGALVFCDMIAADIASSTNEREAHRGA